MNVIDDVLAAVQQMTRDQLKERWRSLFKTAPPLAFTPDLLARGIAHRLQEKQLGGLSKMALTQLSEPVGKPRKAAPALRPGARLVKRWRGATYIVEVTEQGLVHDGNCYGSLSEIATHITGTRWSGPRFFGLRP